VEDQILEDNSTQLISFVGLMQLFTTVQDMQQQLKQVHDTALQLAAEKEDRQHNINVFNSFRKLVVHNFYIQ
jgi:aspartyl/asparaginyl beta-hydroxylase (cupin superfamily)